MPCDAVVVANNSDLTLGFGLRRRLVSWSAVLNIRAIAMLPNGWRQLCVLFFLIL